MTAGKRVTAAAAAAAAAADVEQMLAGYAAAGMVITTSSIWQLIGMCSHDAATTKCRHIVELCTIQGLVVPALTTVALTLNNVLSTRQYGKAQETCASKQVCLRGEQALQQSDGYSRNAFGWSLRPLP